MFSFIIKNLHRWRTLVEHYGVGVEKDKHKAFICYQKFSEIRNASGINSVGYCYCHGIGIEKDEHKAFIYYQKPAET